MSFPALAMPGTISGEHYDSKTGKHTQKTLPAVANLEVLVGEAVAIDGLSAGAYREHLAKYHNDLDSIVPSPRVKSPP